MKRGRKKPDRVRVNMRVPADLLVWAREYAIAKNVTVTQLFVSHLTELQEKACGLDSISR